MPLRGSTIGLTHLASVNVWAGGEPSGLATMNRSGRSLAGVVAELNARCVPAQATRALARSAARYPRREGLILSLAMRHQCG